MRLSVTVTGWRAVAAVGASSLTPVWAVRLTQLADELGRALVRTLCRFG